MLDSKDFYNSYQLNFFDYKQGINRYILQLDDQSLLDIAEGIYHTDPHEFRNSILLDIRMTCLWSIDTLFELIYALLPDHKARLQDNHILDNLSKKDFYYRDLGKYIRGSKGKFERLKWAVIHKKQGDEKTYLTSVYRHIFYKGLLQTEYEDQIKESEIVLKEILKYLGKEISENREQLNSLKHGLKLFPFLKTLELKSNELKSTPVKVDLEGSFSFQKINRKTGSRSIYTATLNQDRDFALTELCSNLIYNVIILRKTELENFKFDGKNMAFIFTRELINQLKELHPKINNLKIDIDRKSRISPVHVNSTEHKS